MCMCDPTFVGNNDEVEGGQASKDIERSEMCFKDFVDGVDESSLSNRETIKSFRS